MASQVRRELIAQINRSLARLDRSAGADGRHDDLAQPETPAVTHYFAPEGAGEVIGADGELEDRSTWQLDAVSQLEYLVAWSSKQIRVHYTVRGEPPSADLWLGIVRPNGDAFLWVNLGRLEMDGSTSLPRERLRFDPTGGVAWRLRFHVELGSSPERGA